MYVFSCVTFLIDIEILLLRDKNYFKKKQNCCFYSYLYIIQAVLKKNGPRYNFAIDDPNEKNYAGNEMALKTLQT
jgi:hypothetical protein